VKQKTREPDFVREARIRREQEIKDLESRAKSACELVVEEGFIVNDVLAGSSSTHFTPQSEIRYGGTSPSYSGGFISRLVLQVSPNNKKVPIQTLYFDGFSIVRAGEQILARIPKYEVRRVEQGFFNDSPSDRARVFYVERDFKPQESAIEISILDSSGKPVRIERSTDYARMLNP